MGKSYAFPNLQPLVTSGAQLGSLALQQYQMARADAARRAELAERKRQFDEEKALEKAKFKAVMSLKKEAEQEKKRRAKRIKEGMRGVGVADQGAPVDVGLPDIGALLGGQQPAEQPVRSGAPGAGPPGGMPWDAALGYGMLPPPGTPPMSPTPEAYGGETGAGFAVPPGEQASGRYSPEAWNLPAPTPPQPAPAQPTAFSAGRGIRQAGGWLAEQPADALERATQDILDNYAMAQEVGEGMGRVGLNIWRGLTGGEPVSRADQERAEMQRHQAGLRRPPAPPPREQDAENYLYPGMPGPVGAPGAPALPAMQGRGAPGPMLPAPGGMPGQPQGMPGMPAMPSQGAVGDGFGAVDAQAAERARMLIAQAQARGSMLGGLDAQNAEKDAALQASLGQPPMPDVRVWAQGGKGVPGGSTLPPTGRIPGYPTLSPEEAASTARAGGLVLHGAPVAEDYGMPARRGAGRAMRRPGSASAKQYQATIDRSPRGRMERQLWKAESMQMRLSAVADTKEGQALSDVWKQRATALRGAITKERDREVAQARAEQWTAKEVVTFLLGDINRADTTERSEESRYEVERAGKPWMPERAFRTREQIQTERMEAFEQMWKAGIKGGVSPAVSKQIQGMLDAMRPKRKARRKAATAPPSSLSPSARTFYDAATKMDADEINRLWPMLSEADKKAAAAALDEWEASQRQE